ncbi:uncharacterized protein A1O9_09863 [Exophiala aquamarina CBS 119918]|uniref:Proline dehydrogenase n=1 Tax=Exophiala aquamarina CBS 119918 TaxID=1182545 RepID=A0A072P470_9EURO|nr:uncharacterized protein A1O9_09863 [Exophiala aquamarina CBS 119918]KEF54068.1 hypothetical protein A1O9_09863 [Exophiala aquamarina CBS 119918]
MNFVAHSKSRFLDPDQNPVVRGLIRAAIYNHFCAGTSPAEVKATIKQIKSAGYAGVILGYGREIVIDTSEAAGDRGKDKDKLLAGVGGREEDKHIALWLQGNLTTLEMIGRGDYMNVKFTGAGPRVSQCLIDGTKPPEQLSQAIDKLCHQARSQGSRIWIDAEQQIFQPSIDAWTIDLMRRHNIHGNALVFNTIQAYLKSSRETVAKHLQVASDEAWTLGIKLVRGAYIASDVRERIWDTKAETDESYNSIARDLLSKNIAEGAFLGFKVRKFPDLRLFLAGHNTESIRQAILTVRELVMAGQQVPPVEYGQLHGMADDVSCDLVEQYERAVQNFEKHKSEGSAVSAKYELELQAAPVAYKCLNWGSVRECLHFLLRRAVENASAAERIKEGLPELRGELKRRLWRAA